MSIFRACFCAAALVAAAFPARAQVPETRVHLLEVPYLPQNEALCGGAAAAMVMRFWGAADVYADTFGDLVDPRSVGIRGEDLARAMQRRGWQVLTFKGDTALVRSNVQKGRPLIVLIEDRPGTFHYVVVVSMDDSRAVVHDPARAPYRVIDAASFQRAWARSGFWTLLALPPAGVSRNRAPERGERAAPEGHCDTMVNEGVQLAIAGNTDEARRVLESASAACPAEAGPWRERAGLHVLRKEWPEAAADARQALRRDRKDEHAARILATSLFLEGDTLGALDAWNVAGEPGIDLVNVNGLERTRYEVVARALALEPRTILTSASLLRARRNAAEVPSALVSRVSYRPSENGRAQVDAVIVERPLVPSKMPDAMAAGLHAVTEREVAAFLASPSGGGELWTASWRWWENRPRAALSLAAPAPGRMHGTWRVDVFDDRQTYVPAGDRTIERRRGAALELSDWVTGNWRWATAVGVDRWRGRGTSIAVAADSEYRAFRERLVTTARLSLLGGGVDTWTAALGGQWRTRSGHEGQVLIARVGIEAAGLEAPYALWPGASTGQGRGLLLRAHRLLRDGVIEDGVFGRRIVHGGAEWRRWLRPVRGVIRLAPAAFADAARASRTTPAFDTRFHIDAGVGIRLAIPGSGVLRVDAARGVRDGNTVLSAGWTR